MLKEGFKVTWKFSGYHNKSIKFRTTFKIFQLFLAYGDSFVFANKFVCMRWK